MIEAKEISASEALLEVFNTDTVASFLDRNISDKSKKVYRIVLVQFIRYAAGWDDYGSNPTHTMTKLVDDFLKFKQFATSNSFKMYKKTISSYLEWLYANGMMPFHLKVRSTWRGTAKQVMENDLRRFKMASKVLTHEEVTSILDWCKYNAPREYIAIMFMYNFGMRGSEVLAIQRKHFRYMEGGFYLWTQGKVGKRLKRGSWIQLPRKGFLEDVASYMRTAGLRDKEDFLYPKHTKSAQKTFVEAGQLVAVSTGGLKTIEGLNHNLTKIVANITGKRLTSHCFRRSRITTLAAEGFSPYDIARLVRIENINTIRSYYDKSSVLDKFGSSMVSSL
jgi:integrase